jgi:hypothetical protein
MNSCFPSKLRSVGMYFPFLNEKPKGFFNIFKILEKLPPIDYVIDDVIYWINKKKT